MVAETDLLTAALSYAARGWAVMPLHTVRDGRCTCGGQPDCTPGKHPRTKHGLKDATTDEATIRKWWSMWPDANIAIPTGTASGLLMIGPDGDQGKKDLADLEAEHGKLPATPTQASGSGGEHRLFRYPTAGKVTNRVNHRGKKIDVRGDGGYFVAAPSHNAVGPYVWVIDPDAAAVAEPPDWLVEWATTQEKRSCPPPPRPTEGPVSDKRIRAYLAKCHPAIQGQNGSAKLMFVASALIRGFKLTHAEAFAWIKSDYNPSCVPEWSDKEIDHKLTDAARNPLDKLADGWLLVDRASQTNRGKLAADPDLPREGHAVILDYFRRVYRPAFRRGVSLYSSTLSREVKMGEATAGSPKALIDELASASNAPRTKDGTISYNHLPQFFNTWSRSAWVDLLNGLPDEDGSAGDGSAQEEFRRWVRQALLTQITFPVPIKDAVGRVIDHRQERRSVIDWCEAWADPEVKDWQDLRSYRCWFRYDGQGVLQVAVRHDLFAQLGGVDRRLVEIGHTPFAKRCRLYKIGTASDDVRPQGWRAVLLDADFIADLTSKPAAAPQKEG